MAKCIIPSTTIGIWGIMRTQLAAVLAIIIVIVAIISAYYFLESNSHQSSPSKPLPLVELNLAPSGSLNATQGGVTSVNVTLTSLNMSETAIPLSLVLQAYNNTPLDSPTSHNELFSSTFTLNPIVLKSNETETSTLTLHVAEGAPTGKYTFLVEFGNAEIHHLVGATLELNVAPSP
jgi:hypothetical protein